jgi:hypothetical protein
MQHPPRQDACPGHFLDVYEPIDGVTFVTEEETTALIRSARTGSGAPPSGGSSVDTASASSANSCANVDGANIVHPETETGSIRASTVGDKGADADTSVGGITNSGNSPRDLSGGSEHSTDGNHGNHDANDVVVFTGQSTIRSILQRYLPKPAGEAGDAVGSDAPTLKGKAQGLVAVNRDRTLTRHVTTAYSLLRPVADLRKAIDDFAIANDIASCFGIHVRRTVNAHSHARRTRADAHNHTCEHPCAPMLSEYTRSLLASVYTRTHSVRTRSRTATTPTLTHTRAHDTFLSTRTSRTHSTRAHIIPSQSHQHDHSDNTLSRCPLLQQDHTNMVIPITHCQTHCPSLQQDHTNMAMANGRFTSDDDFVRLMRGDRDKVSKKQAKTAKMFFGSELESLTPVCVNTCVLSSFSFSLTPVCVNARVSSSFSLTLIILTHNVCVNAHIFIVFLNRRTHAEIH